MLNNHIARSISILSFLLVFAGCTSNKNPEKVNREDAKKGEVLFYSTGCTRCHSVSGESGYGPPLNTIFDKEVIIIRNGRQLSIKPDRKYIINSIMHPESEKLSGYQDKKMPSVGLSAEDIDYIADYLIYINTAIDNN